MKKIIFIVISVLLTLPCFAINTGAIYDVIQIKDHNMIISGKSNPIWDKIPAIEGNFHFPWENEIAPKTIFKSFHDNKNLYFLFDVTDNYVLFSEQWENESTLDHEDRVEIFFAKDTISRPNKEGKIQDYYAIEIDPKGRVHDYSAKYYRNFDSSWQLKGLVTKASITEKGYIVEGSIPLSSLQQLGVLNNNKMNVGIFRAEFTPINDDINMRWISWLSPDSVIPDFHIESAFGIFRLL